MAALEQHGSRHSGAGIGDTRAYWRTPLSTIAILVTVVLLQTVGAAPNRRQRDITALKTEAIARLSKVFGIENPPHIQTQRAPPQYMLDLYHSIADTGGITKTATPYNADIVRGLPDRDTVHQMHFQYNVSLVDGGESVQEAEFHLFKLRPQGDGRHRRSLHSARSHIILLKIYQVMEPENMYAPGGLRLLDTRRVSAHSRGWETFNVRGAVDYWLNNTDSNHGILVEAQGLNGERVNGSMIRFAQRSQHHDSKQPVLVVFSKDGRKQRIANTNDLDFTEFREEYANEYRRILRNRQNMHIRLLNERDRAQWAQWQRSYFSRRSQQRSQQRNQQRSQQRRRRQLASEDSETIDSESNSDDQEHGIQKRAADSYNFSRKRKQSCSRRQLYVDFDEIGWSGWIISPQGYNAYHCKGECPFPLGQNQKPTNHATVQSIVHALRVEKDISEPCCVPNKLYSISLLYFDDHENVILKQYDDMVAASCGCH